MRQVMSIMIACAVTWTFGSMTHFFAPISSDHARRADAIVDQDLPAENHAPSSKDMYRQVHFLDQSQVDLNDQFSATWLQPLENFLKMNVDGIKTVEDGCFQAFRTNPRAVRMTLDWLDFSVEHMSKWWKVANVFGKEDAIPFNRAVTAFQSYTRNTKLDTHQLSPLRETFAIIAFQPYIRTLKNDSPRARPLTVASLAATIASLVNVGVGRVVVAGMNEMDKSIAQETFSYLRDTLDPNSKDHTLKNNARPVAKIGPMEVGYVQVKSEEAKTKFIDTNMPKGALHVLQHGFKGDLDMNRTIDLFGTTTDKSHWKYIYLTEPDIILQTKQWALPQLKNALDQGLVLAPHRLQPLPHEADFIGMKDETRFVKAEGNFSTVLDLDPLEGAVCCDEQAGSYKPWKDYFGSCGTFWWECHFNKDENSTHSHLTPYSLIRLRQGTGIVSLSATAHGRRCFPKKNGECFPRDNDSSNSSTALIRS